MGPFSRDYYQNGCGLWVVFHEECGVAVAAILVRGTIGGDSILYGSWLRRQTTIAIFRCHVKIGPQINSRLQGPKILTFLGHIGH